MRVLIMNRKQLAFLFAGTAVLATAVVLLVLQRQESSTEKPPKGAPQLDLQNPGDQSEFTTSATESEVG
ncbi:MAG: hypothetical protein JWP27_1605 [Flaviaesturariibacter sp.]|nr:hypothetical protein [Flaviaesturariibacter sp.]